MLQEGVATPTCITCFALKRKDAEKKYARLKRKYSANGKFIVKDIKPSDFSYESIRPDE